MAGLKKAGSNWVDGDRFFDRDGELELLTARVQNGTHTLLTAQRRMGKTSLIRELLRRLRAEGRFETVFVDLEDATTAADAVVEIGVESRDVHGAWDRIKAGFANILGGIEDRIDELAVAEVRVKLRAGIDAGSWRQKGDTVCAALAGVVPFVVELRVANSRSPLRSHLCYATSATTPSGGASASRAPTRCCRSR